MGTAAQKLQDRNKLNAEKIDRVIPTDAGRQVNATACAVQLSPARHRPVRLRQSGSQYRLPDAPDWQ